MDDDLEVMKSRFDDHLDMLKSKKGKNHQLFTREEYNSFFAKVKERKEKTSGKTPEDYQRLSRYDIVRIGSVEKLIVPVKNEKDPIIYYTCMEENFQIIHEIHIAIGHGGRNRMMREVKAKYKNITVEMVMIYLNLCEPCQKKQSVPRKGLVVKPIKSSELNSRCQVDLIDMQSQADGDFKFIMVYQDHLTKFIQLRALKTKRAEEVAYHLLDVFTIFGAPCILQSDNGREFANKIIEEVCGMWNELKIVHGKPRHSQSQGSVERANQDIEKMLSTWLETNNTTKWSEGIKFIQFMKNRAHHSGINRSPYEAIFGCKAKVGLRTYLPVDTLSGITSEEDLVVLRNQSNNDVQLQTAISTEDEDIGAMNDDNMEVELGDSSEDLEVITVAGPIKNRNKSVGQIEGEQHNSEIEKTDDGKRKTKSFVDVEMEDCEENKEDSSFALDEVSENIQKARRSAKQSLNKQAEKMLRLSKLKFPTANVGETVRIRIPEVDRGKADSRNIIAVITSKENENLYKLDTKHGILKQLYTRNDFTVCKEAFISVNEVPVNEISLRECARKDSNLGGQGFQYCNCRSNCNSSRCKCKKSKTLCNSKCHSSSSCQNK
jgi:hypothetical protein